MYISSITSNGNDLNIYMYGYYSGYGLTVNCSQSQDNCIIYCAGTSCINLTLNCVSHDSSIASLCTKKWFFVKFQSCQQ